MVNQLVRSRARLQPRTAGVQSLCPFPDCGIKARTRYRERSLLQTPFPWAPILALFYSHWVAVLTG